MHVLFVSREFPPAPGGGIRTYLMAVAAAMGARGTHVSVLTERVFDSSATSTLGNGVKVYRVPVFDPEKGSAGGLPEETRLLLPEAESLMAKCDPEAAWALRVAYMIREIHAKNPIDIIEGQEYDAPLYYFLQLRLASPDFPRIPVVTHMHSPTELTKLYDEDAPFTPQNAYRKAMEKYCAAAADGVCAPSETLARWTDDWLGAEKGATRVIRLPLSGLEKIAAAPARPVDGGAAPEFLFVGRIELRKGIETLARAVVRLVPDLPDLRVHIVGGDCTHPPMGRSTLEWLRERVLVHGGQAAVDAFHVVGKGELGDLWNSDHAGSARACLVPSMWDNSPYTCIEAMARGHLMVVSDHGGQSEFVEDGRSGIVFPHRSPSALAEAMRKVAEMPPGRRAEMGQAARERILALCGTEKVVAERLAFYSEVAESFRARGSRPRVPHSLPFQDASQRDGHPKANLSRRERPGTISIVVPCYNMGAFLHETLDSLIKSERTPDEVLVVDDGSTDARTREMLDTWSARKDLPFPLKVHRTPNQGLAMARRTGAAQTRGDYLVFLDADDCVTPGYLTALSWVLDQHPEVGVATAWYEYFGEGTGHWTPLAAQFPLLLMENCVGAGAMVRRTAYDEAGGPKPAMRYNFEDWEFWVSVAAKGWVIMTVPQPLFRYRVREGSMYREMNLQQFGLLRARMMRSHADLFRRYATDCLAMAESGTGVAKDFLGRVHSTELEALQTEVLQLRSMVAMVKAAPRHPSILFGYALRKARGKWRRFRGT